MTERAALPKNHPKIWWMVEFQLSIIIFFPPTIFSAILDNSSVLKSWDPDCAITPAKSYFWGSLSQSTEDKAM